MPARVVGVTPSNDKPPTPNRPHDISHTTATWMLVRGTPVQFVARSFGHANPSFNLYMYASYNLTNGSEAGDDLKRPIVWDHADS